MISGLLTANRATGDTRPNHARISGDCRNIVVCTQSQPDRYFELSLFESHKWIYFKMYTAIVGLRYQRAFLKISQVIT